MKKNILSLLLICLTSLSMAGNITKSLEIFTSVEFTGNYKVEMIKADSNYIEVINNDEAKVPDADIQIEVVNKSFKMYLKQDLYAERAITVKLFYTLVESVTARRGAQIVCDTLLGSKISVSVTTGGKIKLNVKAEHLIVSIKSGGSIRVKGVADSASYEVNAGGTIAAAFMNVKSVDATIQFGGEIILNATDNLWAAVKAGGTISYKGNPIIKSQSIKLGGTIENLETSQNENK